CNAAVFLLFYPPITAIYALSLHDALPICQLVRVVRLSFSTFSVSTRLLIDWTNWLMDVPPGRMGISSSWSSVNEKGAFPRLRESSSPVSGSTVPPADRATQPIRSGRRSIIHRCAFVE